VCSRKASSTISDTEYGPGSGPGSAQLSREDSIEFSESPVRKNQSSNSNTYPYHVTLILTHTGPFILAPSLALGCPKKP
jgi:hypothetical protein